MWGNALTQFLERLDPSSELTRRRNRTLLDHQRWTADMEPEVVIAVIAPGLAISTCSIETLPNTLHVGPTFEADGRLKGIVHELEATGFGHQHLGVCSASSGLLSLLCLFIWA